MFSFWPILFYCGFMLLDLDRIFYWQVFIFNKISPQPLNIK